MVILTNWYMFIIDLNETMRAPKLISYSSSSLTRTELTQFKHVYLKLVFILSNSTNKFEFSACGIIAQFPLKTGIMVKWQPILPHFSAVWNRWMWEIQKVTTAGTEKSHSKQPSYSFTSYKDLVRFEDSIHQDIQIKTWCRTSAIHSEYWATWTRTDFNWLYIQTM